LRIAVEVRDQQLHPGVRVERLDRADGLGVQPGAAVGEIVAGHPGDRRIAQPHRVHALGDPARLVGVELGRFAGVDLAEVTPAGALLAADQEGRLAVLPAFEDVGAARLLAHRVQTLAPDQRLEVAVLRTHRRAGLDPRRFAFDRGLRVAHLQPQQFAALRRDCHVSNATFRRPSSASATVTATRSVTSATVTRRPSSAVSDVTPASVIPHGTIEENAPRSQSQFSANPCMVTPRLTRIPIAATLRAGRAPEGATQTPERPATRTVGRPTAAHTAISASSSRRTKSTTSIGSARPTIG